MGLATWGNHWDVILPFEGGIEGAHVTLSDSIAFGPFNDRILHRSTFDRGLIPFLLHT